MVKTRLAWLQSGSEDPCKVALDERDEMGNMRRTGSVKYERHPRINAAYTYFLREFFEDDVLCSGYHLPVQRLPHTCQRHKFPDEGENWYVYFASNFMLHFTWFHCWSSAS